MYLSKLKTSDYVVPNNDIIKNLYEALDSNKIAIKYYVDTVANEIEYYFSDEQFGSVSFIINSEGKITYASDSSLIIKSSLLPAFIMYLYNKEKNASGETLEKLYPDIYELEFMKKNMTYQEREQYEETKANFFDMMEDFDNHEEIVMNEDKLYLCLRFLNSEDLTEYSLNASINNGESYDFSSAFERYILNGRPLDSQSKEILYAFSSLYMNESYYSPISDRSLLQILGQGLKVLRKQKGPDAKFRSLYVEYEPYFLETETKDVQVSIDENGNIITSLDSYEDLTPLSFNMPKEVLCLDRKRYVAFFVQTKTEAEMKLLDFKLNNPMFNSKYFEKEISHSLVPAVKDVIEIEPKYLTNSLKKIDHIEYYIDLDKEKLELICKTFYFYKGNKVDLEAYQKALPKQVEDFKIELILLGMIDEGRVSDQDTIVSFISQSLTNLKKTCQVFVSEDVKKLKKKPVAKINIAVQSQQDWFSLKFNSNEYTDEEINSILSAYKKKKKYYRLRDDILTLDEGNGQDIISLMNDFDLKQEKIPVYQALKLKARQDVSLSQDLKELFEKIQNYDDVEIHVNKKIKEVLRPYQIKGIQWLNVLKEHHLSGILADDMGLGKTLEIIAFLSQFNEKKPNLVVSPKSLIYNWEDEFHKWNKDAKVVVLSSNKEDRHQKLLEMKEDQEVTYIISYDSLRIDLELFKNKQFGFLILDEGQFISNSLSQKSRAVKTLTADYKFALTGTPIQNSLMDLWSLFDFLMPGYLKSFTEFKKIYGKFDLNPEERKHLENIVSPFLLKRRKDDVLTELPGKVMLTQNLTMDEEERKLYEAYLVKAQNAMKAKQSEGGKHGIEVLSALTRLRQLCVDPSSFLEYKNISSKLEYTMMLIKEAVSKNHKILLFSSFTSVLDHLAILLDKENITYGRIQGDTSASKRIKLVKDFNQNDDIKVMLISLKAGGTGLNLVGADIVIHLDPWWNIAAEDQASDRAYRIGQTRKVTIYKLVMKNTIEEKVLTLQEKKKDLSDIFDNINAKTSLSDEDINYLLN